MDPYNPTPDQKIGPAQGSWRQRLARLLLGNEESFARQQFVEGVTGSDGLGEAGTGLVDFVPGGQAFAVEEALRAGDPQMAGLAAFPVVGAKAKGAGKALAEAIEGAPFPQYAERYPDIAPPVLQKDPKTGKEFMGKGETPETKVFMKERARIAKQMEKEGFEPYFDPAQRFDVDPSHYPTDHVTLTQNRGKTPKTADQADADASNPGAMERLEAAYLRGRDVPDADRWYFMGQLEKAYIDELGEEAGREAFRQRFAGAMAATTGGADPTGNLLAAHYGNYLATHGQPIPENAHAMPVPVGGRFISGNMRLHGKFGQDGMNIPGDSNPKRYNFANNFLGHADRATIDEQMMGLIQPGGPGAPDPAVYGHFEQPVHALAAKHGISPREFQEVAWAGGKQMKNEAKKGMAHSAEAGVPMIQTVNEAIERTHRLTGMPREEIVRRGLIRAEIPLYSSAGALLGARMMLGDEE